MNENTIKKILKGDLLSAKKDIDAQLYTETDARLDRERVVVAKKIYGPVTEARSISVPEKHQLKIAKDTLKMHDAAVGVMGGPSKEEARAIILKLTGKKAKE